MAFPLFLCSRSRGTLGSPIGTISGAVLSATQIVAAMALWASATEAQIAIDNTSSAAGDTATLKFSHTVDSGPNSLLMVGVEVHAKTTVEAVVWSADSPVALTQVGSVTDSGDNVTVELWKLVNPPAGAGDIVITLSAERPRFSGWITLFPWAWQRRIPGTVERPPP
jgi:hypothetical protein